MASVMTPGRLDWYRRRLMAMSPGEIAHRVSFALRKGRWRRRRSWTAPAPDIHAADPWRPPVFGGDHLDDAQAVLAEADRYARGEYTLLNFSYTEPDIDWLRDPDTGRVSPLAFGPDIDYRDHARVGNYKNIWEKSRFHHLTILALAHALTKKGPYADTVHRQLLSWAGANPAPLGINWHSPLELGVRLISLTWIERLLRGTTAHDELFGASGAMWPVVYWSQWMIEQSRSHGSSANNHLIGEMAGLLAAALQWPYFDESDRWRRLAMDALEKNIVAQTFPSGLNREMAFSYHLFTLEFFTLCGIEAERFGAPFSQTYRDRARRMFEVIPMVLDTGAALPSYGDGDEGMALLLRPSGSSRLDWLFRLGGRWLGAGTPAPPGGSGALAADLILPGVADRSVAAHEPPASAAFEDAGVYVLSSGRGTPEELFVLADAGPLGFLATAAHGHADALSFTLSAGGAPVLVDPGTYTYHADPHWRDYFRSTKAHNTVTVDGKDQSEMGGPFLWTHKAVARAISFSAAAAGGVLIAEHDGYRRPGGGVVHRRTLALDARTLTVTDDLTGGGTHEIEWRLHFDPAATVRLDGAALEAVFDGGAASFVLDGAMRWALAKGEDDAGWVSKGFNLKTPACTLKGTARVNLPVTLVNRLSVSFSSRSQKS